MYIIIRRLQILQNWEYTKNADKGIKMQIVFFKGKKHFDGQRKDSHRSNTERILKHVRAGLEWIYNYEMIKHKITGVRNGYAKLS